PRLDLTALYALYTKRFSILNGLFVACIEIILFPVVSLPRPPDPIPLLQPYYWAFIAPTDRSAPVLRLGTLASRFCPLGLLPYHRTLVPAVPYNRLHPLHALSTPVATCSVTRHPADSSQKNHTLLVSTTLDFLTTRHQRVHFRSSLGRSPAQVFPHAFPPTLTTDGF